MVICMGVIFSAGCTNIGSTNPTSPITTAPISITLTPIVSVSTPEPTTAMIGYPQISPTSVEQPLQMLPTEATIYFVPASRGVPVMGAGYDELLDGYGCKYYIFPKDLQNVTNVSEYSGESHETFNGIPILESVKFLSSTASSGDTTEYFYNNTYWHKCNDYDATEINNTPGQPVVNEIPPHPNSAVFSLLLNNGTILT
jgi:hypothetical protein